MLSTYIYAPVLNAMHFSLKTEAARSPEMILSNTTQHHNPEDLKPEYSLL